MNTLAEAIPVARFAIDSLEAIDDMRKVFHLRDAHAALDRPLSRARFLPNTPTLAGRPVPVTIGMVASIPALLATSDGSVAFLADAPLASVDVVLDRGDPLTVDDYQLDPSAQQLLLANAPLGPVVADGSSIGPDTPATLTQMLADVFARCGVTAWSQADAEAIDSATGYAGIGYYDGAGDSGRTALARILPSYGAWWYRDGAGVIRLVRMVDPDDTADADLAFDLVAAELADDAVVVPDAAPNLTRRMAYQPNAYIHAPGDLVSDLEDVPPARRIALTSACRGEVHSRVPLAARYAHAATAPAFVSLFWRKSDAQAELDRVLRLYGVQRNFITWRQRGAFDLNPEPGQVGRITYPRYGLAAGRKVLVRDVQRNPSTGDITLTLWGRGE